MLFSGRSFQLGEDTDVGLVSLGISRDQLSIYVQARHYRVVMPPRTNTKSHTGTGIHEEEEKLVGSSEF